MSCWGAAGGLPYSGRLVVSNSLQLTSALSYDGDEAGSALLAIISYLVRLFCDLSNASTAASAGVSGPSVGGRRFGASCRRVRAVQGERSCLSTPVKPQQAASLVAVVSSSLTTSQERKPRIHPISEHCERRVVTLGLRVSIGRRYCEASADEMLHRTPTHLAGASHKIEAVLQRESLRDLLVGSG